jgi:hypothetical protein
MLSPLQAWPNSLPFTWLLPAAQGGTGGGAFLGDISWPCYTKPYSTDDHDWVIDDDDDAIAPTQSARRPTGQCHDSLS